MNINLNVDKIIEKVSKNPWLIVIGILISLTIFFAYLFNTENKRTTVNCDFEINKLRNDYVDYQIKCNSDLIGLRKECRNKMDSIETYYFSKLINLERKLIMMEDKVGKLENLTK